MFKEIISRAWAKGLALASAVFTLVPDSFFYKFKISDKWTQDCNLFIDRIIVCIIAVIILFIAHGLYYKFRRKVTIKGKGYEIQVEYGDILTVKGGKKVINFDECFTTTVSDAPANIKPHSVCGQYLNLHKELNDSKINQLISDAGIHPLSTGSEYNNQVRYESGTLVPYRDDLLMSFAKLNKNGRGHLSYAEYLQCLDRLWDQIDQHSAMNDVYIPVLGSRIINFDDATMPSQQELLDIIIESYKLSRKKLKLPDKLHIVCQKKEGFLLNNIDGVK